MNLDVEMETGTGKPIARSKPHSTCSSNKASANSLSLFRRLRSGQSVAQSITDTAEHFLEGYGKHVRSFIYDSKTLHNLQSFSSDSGIDVMIIDVQAIRCSFCGIPPFRDRSTTRYTGWIRWTRSSKTSSKKSAPAEVRKGGFAFGSRPIELPGGEDQTVIVLRTRARDRSTCSCRVGE